ncbi:HIT family protein [Halosolutus amylolyticus]|uniref:HIT family protein n=1 Tax=Halosolutus amylolyticus TaxID=2932267 RepID=A0ABD5PKD8_9EURY|nr:HIT family protein [Halosolutus amylolyticus]
MASCTFCDIIRGKEPAEVVLENERYLCILDQFPVNEGHSLVIPRDHIERLEEIDDETMYEFLEEAHEYILGRFDPDATNIGLNNGPEAGQTIQHLHWHVIPRYEGDIEDPTGGVRGVIPSKRQY